MFRLRNRNRAALLYALRAASCPYAAIGREKTSPDALAYRVLPPLLYGDGHPYAIPLSGTGTEASIAALQREDMLGFQQQVIRPDNATIITGIMATLSRLMGRVTNGGSAMPSLLAAALSMRLASVRRRPWPSTASTPGVPTRRSSRWR